MMSLYHPSSDTVRPGLPRIAPSRPWLAASLAVLLSAGPMLPAWGKEKSKEKGKEK